MKLFATLLLMLLSQPRQLLLVAEAVDTDNCPDVIENVETTSLMVNQINEPGFGDANNKYAFGMASFGDYVYVGTSNIVKFESSEIPFFLGLPLISKGAEIWRARRSENYEWERVFKFTENPNNFGVRKMLVVNQYLYAGTSNHAGVGKEINGAELWKTSDGENWERENTPGFGNPASLSIRSLSVCGNYLYVGLENRRNAAMIYRRAIDEETGDLVESTEWELIMDDGFGDSFNYFVAELLYFRGSLYAGTLNGLNGMQLWKTGNCNAEDPTDVEFQDVFSDRAAAPGDSIFDWGVLTLFKTTTISANGDVMFLGSVNYFGGASLYYSVDGENFMQLSENGLGMFAAYVWSMALYENRVYIGTFNQGSAPEVIFHPSFRNGQFGLLSLDPEDPSASLTVETEDAFGFQCYQDGIRNMVAHDGRLIFGTAGNTPGFGLYIYEGDAP